MSDGDDAVLATPTDEQQLNEAAAEENNVTSDGNEEVEAQPPASVFEPPSEEANNNEDTPQAATENNEENNNTTAEDADGTATDTAAATPAINDEDANNVNNDDNNNNTETANDDGQNEEGEANNNVDDAVDADDGEAGDELDADMVDAPDVADVDMNDEDHAGIVALNVTEYDIVSLKPKAAANQYHHDLVKLYHSFGFECLRRNVLHMLGEDMMLTTAGSSVMLLNLFTLEQQYLVGLDGKGIGALAVHPTRQYFAVGEKGENPNIYIYEFPSLRLMRILRKGTERAFSDLCWNAQGDKLASVGSYPDYLLHVWNWMEESIVLRAKAFSQDVYRVSFSPRDDGILYTSGTGHIRFWKMAETFTGLKLQGDLGKFGNVELSDISSYLEFPDGKVLSGTESGSMLLWDGNLIKVEIVRSMDGGQKKGCHQGMIEQIWMEVTADSKTIVTAGLDGFVRFWSFDALDQAQPGEDNTIFVIEPIKEVKIGSEGTNVQIRCIYRGDGQWLVQDGCGALWKIQLPMMESMPLLAFPAGSVNGLELCPVKHLAATAGEDGNVRIYDYVGKKMLVTQHFNSAASCISWAPRPVDSTSMTFAVGFDDGVVRMLQIGNGGCALTLVKAIKPHTKRVMCMQYCPDGRTLVSGGDDNAIFFMAADQDYAAIGFVVTESCPRSLCWSNDWMKLLCVLQDGSVLEYAAPNPNDTDPSRASFEISIESKKHVFEREPIPKPQKKRKPELPDDDELSADEEAKIKAEINKIEEEENKEMAIYEKAVADREAFAHAAGPSSGRCVMYASDDSFFVTFDGADKGPIWECKFGEKYPTRQIENGADAVTWLSRSTTKRWLLSGSKDGLVRLRPWGATALVEKSWANTVHDRDLGALHGIALSYDDAFMVTVGADGNVLTFMLSPDLLSQAATDMADREAQKAAEMAKLLERKLQEEAKRKAEEEAAKDAAQAAIIATTAPTQPPVEGDIIDPKHYSIEEEKQKAEEDKKLAAAETKKQKIRQHIAEIRQEFLALLEANVQLPPAERLVREEFELDHELRVLLEREAAKKVEEARNKLAWISEKKSLQLAKIKRAFMDEVAVERVVMKAFKSQHNVSSFRCRKLTAQQRANIDAVHALIAQEESIRAKQEGGNAAKGLSNWPAGSTAQNNANAANTNNAGGDHGGAPHGDKDNHTAQEIAADDSGKESSLSKAELRKQQRAEMQKQWEQLMSSKPDDQYEDLNDVAAIAWAEQNMGDYKLKTDPDFVVPEHQRINAEKKRRQMILLEESVYSIKMGFNERFLALRDLKQRIINNIKRDNDRIKQLNAMLGLTNADPWQPEVADEEWPEKREEYTAAALEEFEKKKQAEERAAKGHSGFGDLPTGDGGDGKGGEGKEAAGGGKDAGNKKGGATGGGKPGATTAANRRGNDKNAAAANKKGGKQQQQDKDLDEEDRDKEGDDEDEDGASKEDKAATKKGEQKGPVLEEVTKSELEEAEEYAKKKRLTYERDQLMEKIRKTVGAFDEALMNLRREKFKLEADLKTTDLKMLVLYQELRLLKDFEKKDNSLAQKLEAKRMEKAEIVAKIAECQEKLANKKVEIERLNPKQVYQQFNQVVPENNKFYEELLKIFKKKIKRIKKKTKSDAAEEEDEDGSDGEGSDDDDNMSDLDDDEEDEEEEFCPPGCDPALYESVCELREKRLDQEEILNEFQKSVEALKKDNDALVKKEKVIDSALRQCEAEIQQFQTFKQQRLNEIDVVICLKMHQIQCLVDNKLPANLNHTIVFTNAGLTRLQERIKELQNEKVDLRKQQKQLRKEHVQLMKSKRAKEQRLAELEARARDVQMLKFGQEIDLDTLEQMAVNKTAEELRAQLKKQEAHAQHELEVWKQRIEEASAELARVTIANTDKLERVSELTAQQHKLEKELNSTQTRMVAEVGPSKESMKLEREQLVNLVKLQAKEMEALKAEINMLRRKGGHVYTPVMRQKADGGS